MNRAEIGQLKLTREPLDLTAALQPVFEIGKQLAAEKSLAWTLRAPPSLPAVWGDAARLRDNQVTAAVRTAPANAAARTLCSRHRAAAAAMEAANAVARKTK
ncbi:MAG: hypothetical protein ACOYYI_06485 [Chloroflexota bacterium]